METFDDFDTQVQCDEMPLSFYVGFEVDCDDGTSGDTVYIKR